MLKHVMAYIRKCIITNSGIGGNGKGGGGVGSRGRWVEKGRDRKQRQVGRKGGGVGNRGRWVEKGEG